MKKMVVNRGSAQGVLVDMTDANIAQNDIDKAAHEAKKAAYEAEKSAPYKPTDLEISIHALEAKAGITKADKDAAKLAIIDEKS